MVETNPSNLPTRGVQQNTDFCQGFSINLQDWKGGPDQLPSRIISETEHLKGCQKLRQIAYQGDQEEFAKDANCHEDPKWKLLDKNF